MPPLHVLLSWTEDPECRSNLVDMTRDCTPVQGSTCRGLRLESKDLHSSLLSVRPGGSHVPWIYVGFRDGGPRCRVRGVGD